MSRAMSSLHLHMQSSKPDTVKKTLPSYDDVSKFFSLPLSDAADALAACRSDLKKICYENGLFRWPYRKIRSGKSVEEVKMDATRESKKELAEFLRATRERNDALSSSATPLTPGSQIQSKSSTLILEMSASRGFSKQQGSKNSNLNNRTPLNSDEFKYGFPSDGLSTASNKWWGGASVLDGEHNLRHVLGADIQAEQQQSMENFFSAESLLGNSESQVGTGLLRAVRGQAAEEGRALKLGLGVYRYGVAKKLGRKERALLLGIFKSSLPSQCVTWF